MRFREHLREWWPVYPPLALALAIAPFAVPWPSPKEAYRDQTRQETVKKDYRGVPKPSDDGWVYPDEIDRNPDGSYAYDFSTPEGAYHALVEGLNNNDRDLVSRISSPAFAVFSGAERLSRIYDWDSLSGSQNLKWRITLADHLENGTWPGGKDLDILIVLDNLREFADRLEHFEGSELEERAKGQLYAFGLHFKNDEEFKRDLGLKMDGETCARLLVDSVREGSIEAVLRKNPGDFGLTDSEGERFSRWLRVLYAKTRPEGLSGDDRRLAEGVARIEKYSYIFAAKTIEDFKKRGGGETEELSDTAKRLSYENFHENVRKMSRKEREELVNMLERLGRFKIISHFFTLINDFSLPRPDFLRIKRYRILDRVTDGPEIEKKREEFGENVLGIVNAVGKYPIYSFFITKIVAEKEFEDGYTETDGTILVRTGEEWGITSDL